MTDALTNAERLLREAAMLSDDLDGWHSERGESYRAAADALAAERERRGEAVAWQVVDCDGEPELCELSEYDARLERDSLNAPREHDGKHHPRSPFTIRPLYAAPPLPPATGEGPYCAGCGAYLGVGDFRERGHFCAARPTPDPSRCDCGDPSATSCASCIVADYQAQHPSCVTCCPLPARPTPEPSEAMVEAATRAKECLMTYAAGLSLDMDEAREVGHKLRAALAAQEGTP